jgi:hypothetical protein
MNKSKALKTYKCPLGEFFGKAPCVSILGSLLGKRKNPPFKLS